VIKSKDDDLNKYIKQNEQLQDRIFKDRNKYMFGVFTGLTATILVVCGIVFL